MAARRLITAAALAALGLSVPLTLAPDAGAQVMEQPPVENSKFAFEGVINSTAVHVHSGPSNTFYPTMKVEKGAKVKVVGIKYNWLKIEPPAGSFSYVAKAYVTRRGDGKVGRVTNASGLNVRAGSDLNGMKTTVQAKLEQGQDVEILGEQDEYFKIVPPPGAYLFVDQRYVDPIKVVGDPEPGEQVARAGDDRTRPGGAGRAGRTETQTAPPAGTPVQTQPSTRAANGSAVAPDDTGAAPDEPRASGSVLDKFNELEASFKTAGAKPVIEQPLDDLTKGYQALAKAGGVTTSMKRVIDARLAALKLRTTSRDEFLEVQRRQEESRKQRQSLAAEGDELQERMKANEIKIYTAVGTLRTSSLQVGPETLYRLTDPETGRTVVYVRGSDPNLPTLLNQFVGVRGELTGDPQLSLRVIGNPTAAEPVDQTKVNGTVAAQVVPPSLLPKVPISDTAATDQGGAVEPQ